MMFLRGFARMGLLRLGDKLFCSGGLRGWAHPYSRPLEELAAERLTSLEAVAR